MFIEKASTAMQYGGSGVAVYFGFTTDQWQVIGVIGGLAVAVAGFALNAAFRWLHYRLACEAARAGVAIPAGPKA